MDKQLKIIVGAEEADQRIDKFLAQVEQISTRNRAHHLIDNGFILINKKNCKPSAILKLGDVIEVQFPEPQPSELQPLDLKLDILFEDQDVIVLNKPSGLVIHPAAGHAQDTLVNALIAHTDELSMKFGEERPGIVHRIDKETSGLLVVAKTDLAQQKLVEQFKDRKIHRIYYAIAINKANSKIMNEGKVTSFLARHPTDRKKFASIKDSQNKVIKDQNHPPNYGKWAATNYSIVQQIDKLVFIKLKLETGRTHQIRVHMSELGMPLIGDVLYGGPIEVKKIKLERFYLHAAELGFIHPRTNQELKFNCDWPETDQKIIETLGFKISKEENK